MSPSTNIFASVQHSKNRPPRKITSNALHIKTLSYSCSEMNSLFKRIAVKWMSFYSWTAQCQKLCANGFPRVIVIDPLYKISRGSACDMQMIEFTYYYFTENSNFSFSYAYPYFSRPSCATRRKQESWKYNALTIWVQITEIM